MPYFLNKFSSLKLIYKITYSIKTSINLYYLLNLFLKSKYIITI